MCNQIAEPLSLLEKYERGLQILYAKYGRKEAC